MNGRSLISRPAPLPVQRAHVFLTALASARAAARALLSLAVLASPIAASAQQTPAVPLTVSGAVERALAQSHRLAEARAREEGSLAAVDSRRAAERPTARS